MQTNLDWDRYYAVRDKNLPYREALAEYAAIARERFDADAFEAFKEEHLAPLEEITWDFFGTERAKQIIRSKVETLFPDHEHDEFTDLFWSRIQEWRDATQST